MCAERYSSAVYGNLVFDSCRRNIGDTARGENPSIIHHNSDGVGGGVGGKLRQGGFLRLGVGDIENTSNKIWMGVIDGINVIGADDPTPVEE